MLKLKRWDHHMLQGKCHSEVIQPAKRLMQQLHMMLGRILLCEGQWAFWALEQGTNEGLTFVGLPFLLLTKTSSSESSRSSPLSSPSELSSSLPPSKLLSLLSLPEPDSDEDSTADVLRIRERFFEGQGALSAQGQHCLQRHQNCLDHGTAIFWVPLKDKYQINTLSAMVKYMFPSADHTSQVLTCRWQFLPLHFFQIDPFSVAIVVANEMFAGCICSCDLSSIPIFLFGPIYPDSVPNCGHSRCCRHIRLHFNIAIWEAISRAVNT